MKQVLPFMAIWIALVLAGCGMVRAAANQPPNPVGKWLYVQGDTDNPCFWEIQSLEFFQGGVVTRTKRWGATIHDNGTYQFTDDSKRQVQLAFDGLTGCAWLSGAPVFQLTVYRAPQDREELELIDASGKVIRFRKS